MKECEIEKRHYNKAIIKLQGIEGLEKSVSSDLLKLIGSVVDALQVIYWAALKSSPSDEIFDIEKDNPNYKKNPGAWQNVNYVITSASILSLQAAIETGLAKKISLDKVNPDFSDYYNKFIDDSISPDKKATVKSIFDAIRILRNKVAHRTPDTIIIDKEVKILQKHFDYALKKMIKTIRSI